MSKSGNNLIGISGHIGSGKYTFAKLLQLAICDQMGNMKVVDVDKALEWFDPVNPSGWEIKKFAGKLKQIAALLIGCKPEDFESSQFKNSYLSSDWEYFIDGEKVNDRTMRHLTRMTVRELLQKLGTEAIRNNLHSQAWVNALFADYKLKGNMVGQYPNPDSIEYVQSYPKWLVTDVRFPNEASAIQIREGLLFRMDTKYNLVGGRIIYSNDGFLHTSDDPTHESETALDNYVYFDEIISNTGSLSDLYKTAQMIVEKYKLA